jgi:hypothetical protein
MIYWQEPGWLLSKEISYNTYCQEPSSYYQCYH